MITLNKTIDDYKIISYYIGVIICGIGALMIIPIFVSAVFGEWNPMLDFIISMATTIILGLFLILIGKETREHNIKIQWKHGYVIGGLTWIILMILCAIPYHLSGNTKSFLDACFDVMSGFTTTGIILIQNLDHLSVGLNMWRHMLTFIGGQGMIVLALTFITKQTSGGYKLYVGEAKDIELAPNAKGTARIIWKISMIYMAASMAVLWINGMLIGLNPLSSLFHSFYMFASAWSTGGFAPMSQNIMYYHSLSYETVCMVLFILGSLNFGVHYAVWQGKKNELIKNIETQSFFVTSFIACMLTLYWFSKNNIYTNAISEFRRNIFNVLSAHTTTGLGNIYARQFALEWGDFGILIMTIVMLIGGSACSTAGGIKGLRVGIIFKGIVADIKRLFSSERSLKVYKFHHIKETTLDDANIRAAALITICYIVLFAGGTVLGTLCGYPLASAAFESASATGNVGLTIGVSTPYTPTILKLYYIIAMYMGRLEFISVFALIGYMVRGAKKICVRQ